MTEKQKFYVVWKGRRTGIFSSWEACAAQVERFTGAQYKSFTSRRLAEQALREKYAAHVGKPVSSGEWLFSLDPPVAESIAVDAAHSGRTGKLEYQGVFLQTGKEFFRQGPYENGTNNVGEFLAIVHALSLLADKGLNLPVYSDSSTAIAWVKTGRCKTGLVEDKTNAPLFKLIRRAEDWLVEHKTTNPVLKWDTHAWGENPADFNRK